MKEDEIKTESNEEAAVEAEVPQEDDIARELEKEKELSAEYLAMAQRVQADFDNFRRRNESVRADSYAEGQRNVALLMLTTLDNLERALAAATEEGPLVEGIRMVQKNLVDTFTKLDIKPIDRLGEKFDPNLENAMLQGSPDEGDPGTVCQVLQKGYTMAGKVLRHAMVKVVPE